MRPIEGGAAELGRERDERDLYRKDQAEMPVETAQRRVCAGLGGVGDGIPREEHFVIIPASEIMAIVALASSPQDLEERLARIIIGSTQGKDKRPVTAGELRATGAMAMLLKDAIRPNLVQTLEGGPAFV